MAAAPPPMLVDELDAKGTPDELIQDWALREAKNLARLAENRGKRCREVPPLRREVREAALHFLRGLVELSGLPQSMWFDAVLLLDLCYLSGCMQEEALPMVCTVLVSLLKKNDSAMSVAHLADLVSPTTVFAKWLSGTGYAECEEVTCLSIRQLEIAVLESLDWQLNWPSVRTWLLALCDRFDVLSCHVMTSTLEWIFTQSMASAGTLVTHHSACATMAPQRMANGLFCIFLAKGRMVPLAALRPAHLGEEEWQERFCKSQCMGAPPSCLLTPARAAGVLGLLRPVTGTEFRMLQADTLAVVEAMLEIVLQHTAAQQPWPQQPLAAEQWHQPWHAQDSWQPQPAAQAPAGAFGTWHLSPQEQDSEQGRRLVAVC